MSFIQRSTSSIQDVLSQILDEERWPQVESFLRKSVKVVADELQKTQAEGGVRIDVKSLVRDLSSGPLNAELQNFYSRNHRFVAMLEEKNRRAAVETYDFVDKEMPQAQFIQNQMSVIQSRRDEITRLNGSILDLGVYKGSSTRTLAGIFPDRSIHGFDSFEGLPEDWAGSLKGSFGEVKGVLPNMPANVRLYKGWFEDTLPGWFEENKTSPISLLRVDCDLYSSTKTIFDVLGSLVKSGTWIVFDELIGYRGFKDHEYKAFMEFKAKTGIQFEYVSFGLTYALGYVK
ncbi:macrocin-O-methyltransferase TylF [Neorhizobium sp. R1-B]|uniref:TylF/MycF/NovP-related O-methyltransferase n=1 Tax=Neorhizobium TaxID=1525371 RepID=UPI000CF8BB98|nr:MULTISPECIES: TylF/MycF/NovP-related O-methyltransferase [Neorhizobium]TCV76405.1 macrocin-O-methyltransferase TylF [Neorhizobium sp. S3-V5DH]TDX82548.1 macrocin-O-methyltransferase TylF [Neorhizobium sp. R1-B]